MTTVRMRCPNCFFWTDLYGQEDLNMWVESKVEFPHCPICGTTFNKIELNPVDDNSDEELEI